MSAISKKRAGVDLVAASELAAAQDEVRRLRLALEDIRDTAEVMTRGAKGPVQTHALAHLRAKADEALEGTP